MPAPEVDTWLGGSPAPAPHTAGAAGGTRSLSQVLEAYEADLIRAAIAEAGGNVADAARRLKTDRANLYR
ncbi:MAG: nitric oxide reductase transcription regulator, partial [Gemmatimonadales bacterium]|nr:nitric oxide reductase transcription regulator [Gemmatimonadales bacterium]NIN12269.1 nitric oxide reductase transcription regulator [Gemmatimonadales bacterium]NIN50732.1 nitric oxide reductase transcription regulator [Gemmatimonadales bacterium]NIP08196.1 nitric oxide reductase transcription regulator [Gemmatimonadales bacterium]NIR03474.1 nitric oxide reductase transcription regulator [Gemmatimonadales bacterium]